VRGAAYRAPPLCKACVPMRAYDAEIASSIICATAGQFVLAQRTPSHDPAGAQMDVTCLATAGRSQTHVDIENLPCAPLEPWIHLNSNTDLLAHRRGLEVG
jgi:hypothetical protein